MLQKKQYRTKLPATPTKTNVTKEGVPATPTTIKKPIVENQTSGKTKINATKEGVPATTKLPVTPTKTNVTKEGVPATTKLKEFTSNNKDTSNTYKN